MSNVTLATPRGGVLWSFKPPNKAALFILNVRMKRGNLKFAMLTCTLLTVVECES